MREKLAAEELVEQWTVQFLSTGRRTPDPNRFKSVEPAIHDYLAEKRGTFDPSKANTKLTIRRWRNHQAACAFLKDRGIDWSEMRKQYVEVGIEGKRTHE